MGLEVFRNPGNKPTPGPTFYVAYIVTSSLAVDAKVPGACDGTFSVNTWRTLGASVVVIVARIPAWTSKFGVRFWT